MVRKDPLVGPTSSCAPRAPLESTKDPPLIGKHELLMWISEVLGDIGEEVDFDTLRFGHVILRIFQAIWPDLMMQYEQQVCVYPQTSADVAANWKIIELTLKKLGIPVSFVNQTEIRAGTPSACYQALVLLFFLHRLARDHECEFVLAHPVDFELTKFMSSEAPLACLVSGGSVELPSPLREKILTPRSSAPLQTQGGVLGSCDLSGGKTSSKLEPHKFADVRDFDSRKSLPWDDAVLGGDLENAKFFPEEKPEETGAPFYKSGCKTPESEPNCPLQTPHQPRERQLSISPKAPSGPPAGTNAHIVGGTFDSEGQFSASSLVSLTAPASLPNLVGSGSRKDAEVQTQGLNTTPFISSSIEWCDEKQRFKGEQLVEALRYQLELAQRQLQQGEAEMAAYRRQQRLQLDQMKALAEAEMHRHQQQSQSEILDLKNKYVSDLQAIRNQTDLRMRQIEDDLAIDIEVLSSKQPYLSIGGNECFEGDSRGIGTCPSDSSALAKVTKLQKVMEERLQSRDAASREIKAMLDDIHSECNEFRKTTERYWVQWASCKELRDSVISLVAADTEVENAEKAPLNSCGLPEAKDEFKKKVLALLGKHDFPLENASLLEHALVQLLVEMLSIHSVQQHSQTQERFELQRKLHALKQSHPVENLDSNCHVKEPLAGLQQEVRLQDKVRRLEAQNHRLSRMTEYLRLKVDHIKMWKGANTVVSVASEMTGARAAVLVPGQSDDSAAGNLKGVSATDPSGKVPSELENGACQLDANAQKEAEWISQVLLRPPLDSQERDAELLSLLRSLGQDSELTSDCTKNMALCDKDVVESDEGSSVHRSFSIPVETRDKLLKMFWLMLGDFYRFEARFAEGSVQIHRLQRCLRENMQRRNELEANIRKCKAELSTTFERQLQKERSHFQKLLGRFRVRLMAAEETLGILQKEKARNLEEQQAMMKVFHQTDHSRFATLLERIEVVEAANIMLRCREQCWNELAKALSKQLQTPTIQNQTAIQDIWCQLRGSDSLVAPALALPKIPEAEESKPQKGKPRAPFVKGHCKRSDEISKRTKINNTKNFPLRAALSDPSHVNAVTTCLKRETRIDEDHTQIDICSVVSGENICGNSFSECLKQICGECDTSACIGVSHLISSSDILNEKHSPKVGKEIDNSVIPPSNEDSHIENGELPKASCQLPSQWVDVLRKMVEEATVLFEKQRELKTEELELMKGDLQGQLEKRKQLLARITDQETELVNLKQEHAYVKKQYEETINSLESSHAEIQKLKEQQRQLNEAMIKSNAILSASNKELKRVLATTVANVTKIPSITLLCQQYFDEPGANQSCHTDTTSNEALALKCANLYVEGERGTHECHDLQRCVIQSHETTRQDEHPPKLSTAEGSSEEWQDTCEIDTHRLPNESCRTSKSDTMKGSSFTEKPQLPSVHKNGESSGCAARRQNISECTTERSRDDLNGFLHPLPVVLEAATELTQARLCATHESAISVSFDLRREELSYLASSDVPENDTSEENGTLSATTLPTPRSPPKAELAPVVSPSKLLSAVEKQLHGSAKGQKESREIALNNMFEGEHSSKGCCTLHSLQAHEYLSVNKPTSTSEMSSCCQSVQKQESPFCCSDSHAISESEYAKCSEKQSENPGADSSSKDPLVSAETLKSVASPSLENTRTSRAAAARAWEEFVEAYREDSSKGKNNQSTRLQPRSRHLLISEHQRDGARKAHRLEIGDDSDECQLTADRIHKGVPTARNDTSPEDDSFGDSITRETTDSALQEVLNIEQGIQENGLQVQSSFSTHRHLKFNPSDVLDDSGQLTTSASNFLRKLGNELGTRLRPTRKRNPS